MGTERPIHQRRAAAFPKGNRSHRRAEIEVARHSFRKITENELDALVDTQVEMCSWPLGPWVER